MLQQEGINTAHEWRRGESNGYKALDHYNQLYEMCLTTRLDKIL